MPDKLILSGFRFFSEVSPKTIDALESACKVLDFPPQTVVYRPGEAADTLYCLAEGEVELSLEVHDKSLKADVDGHRRPRLRATCRHGGRVEPA